MSVMTKWHGLRDGAGAPTLCLAIDPDTARPVSDLPAGGFDKAAFSSELDGIGASPRFIVPPELTAMALTRPAMLSLSDMLDCALVSLPFPSCVMEFDAGDTRYHVHLSEDPAGADEGYPWMARCVASYPGETGEITMAFPVTVGFGINPGRDASGGGDVGAEPASFRYRASLAPYVDASDATMERASATAELVFRRCAVGFLCAVLLPNTLGLSRDAISVKASLNRARAAKGRAAIPDHTVIRIASYATAEGATRGYAGPGTTEVFLRRSHKRRVAFGAGRTERRWILVPAQVIGYLQDGHKPTVAELLATRAAKPYLLKA